jgi:hypothetical protein
MAQVNKVKLSEEVETLIAAIIIVIERQDEKPGEAEGGLSAPVIISRGSGVEGVNGKPGTLLATLRSTAPRVCRNCNPSADTVILRTRTRVRFRQPVL